jgi:3-carboxy-cis,cis-muconate cycloisomerase
MNALFAPLFGATTVDTFTDGRAWLGALCEVETALARACARAGLIDTVTALEIAAVADELGRADPAQLGREAVAGGNPVIPLVRRLRAGVTERAGADAAAAVHLGATSQDIVDTALMLITFRATGEIAAGLRDCADAAAALAGDYRDTAMAGRTLLQQGVPTTFGALAAVWGAGLDRAGLRLRAVRAELPVQLGGAAGTLAPLHPHGPAVRAAFADELGLVDPQAVWHTERTRIAELAGALGGAAGAVAKPAGDVVLLAQTELGEVHEGAPGDSSAMAHKQNPIAAVTARAGAVQAPGLVATLLAAGAQELQRGAGPWHAEWPALTSLLVTVGGAASRLRDCLTGLRVDAGAMARNLALLAGSVDITDVGHAGDLVDGYMTGRSA